MYYEGVLLWKYIDHLPKIPEDLLQEAFDKASDNALQFANSPGLRKIKDGDNIKLNMQYQRWDPSSKLDAWIKENIYDFDEIGVQFFINEEDRDRFYPHCDKVNRRWVTLYIAETGGDNVTTYFYREHGHTVVRPHRVMVDDLDLIEVIGSVTAEPRRWITMNGLVLHDAYPITGVRKSIVGGVQQDDVEFLRM